MKRLVYVKALLVIPPRSTPPELLVPLILVTKIIAMTRHSRATTLIAAMIPIAIGLRATAESWSEAEIDIEWNYLLFWCFCHISVNNVLSVGILQLPKS